MSYNDKFSFLYFLITFNSASLIFYKLHLNLYLFSINISIFSFANLFSIDFISIRLLPYPLFYSIFDEQEEVSSDKLILILLYFLFYLLELNFLSA